MKGKRCVLGQPMGIKKKLRTGKRIVCRVVCESEEKVGIVACNVVLCAVIKFVVEVSIKRYGLPLPAPPLWNRVGGSRHVWDTAPGNGTFLHCRESFSAFENKYHDNNLRVFMEISASSCTTLVVLHSCGVNCLRQQS